MNDNAEIWLTLLFMVHIWLVVRFCVLHMFRQANNRPYHLKWLMLVFFLPYLGYGLYFWLTRRYVTKQH
ncbi:hypothetical protein DLD77_00980 [Chitinophaga alhagiae]|uniref:Cardiolipin synthase N-terminal domain-containing protein n=1 Tax=Chitinophaga alhagiae TaxID=2203219 RepID=A0ABM6W8Z3_9BACT|nr:PLDc N-terminal domain-containing protein [Chitinophaga alhagiae]AWO00378.1 hypothetical protein DLD77_00980 [Chitinophaga alhagiae]